MTQEWRGRFLEVLRGRRRLPLPAGSHRERGRQHVVHAPDDEHESDAFQSGIRSQDRVRCSPRRVDPDPRDRTRTLGLGHLRERGRDLGWTDIVFPNPVFAGDTLWAESEVRSVRDSKSRPEAGIVSVRTRGLNQRGEPVVEFLRSFLVFRRDAAEVVGRFPATDATWTVGEERK